jgi:hypothetical protein
MEFMTNLTAQIMKEALTQLDGQLSTPVVLVMGGGGAMILAHGYQLGTSDIDAVPRGISIAELDVLVKKIATQLGLQADWLNPYFSTFSHTLPGDYSTRLIEVFTGAWLKVDALGKEDMLIMKCFAHRQKDVGHARALIKKGADLNFVSNHIEALLKKGIPGAQVALDFLDDVQDL